MADNGRRSTDFRSCMADSRRGMSNSQRGVTDSWSGMTDRGSGMTNNDQQGVEIPTVGLETSGITDSWSGITECERSLVGGPCLTVGLSCCYIDPTIDLVFVGEKGKPLRKRIQCKHVPWGPFTSAYLKIRT